LDLILVGPGRAGLSLTTAAVDSGHRVVGVLARDSRKGAEAAARIGTVTLDWDKRFPAVDLLVIAVSDDAITEVAQRLAPLATEVAGAVHLSGLTSVSALEPLAGSCRVGSFHPLQSFPDVDASRVAGCAVAVTTEDEALAERLFGLAESLGAKPFLLDDGIKGAYHAAASAAANFPVAALSMARQLFEAAGVDFDLAAPLVRTAVESALSMGPEKALTGPVARGDVGTVVAQLAAVEEAAPCVSADFRAFVRAVARVAGTEDIFGGVLL
jgi:predicted short-subunit dehydrogenase-like oxidoreductase (DUF2520 family)